MTNPEPGPTGGNHDLEPHQPGIAQRLNWLRAGVLGANDGIVSVAAVVVGVAGATTATSLILTAGTAALVGGAVSMAVGEYVSVSSQSDSERALIEKERQELLDDPEAELVELATLYEAKGLSPATSRQVASELTAHDPLSAHLSVELNIDQFDVVSPWAAAGASGLAFVTGAALPMLVIMLTPDPFRVMATFAAVLVALAVTGALAAHLGGSSRRTASLRVVVGGAIALAATYAIGSLLDVAGLV